MKPKILLIHGWNWANYTSFGGTDAWSDRIRFVEALSNSFEVVKVNMPGFCGRKDPDTPWVLDDFAEFVKHIIEQENPDYILGYSFGGAVVLRYKMLLGKDRPEVFLVSPAIARRYNKKDLDHIQRIFKKILPEKVTSFLRDIYLVWIVKNPYYYHATKVMRETYRNIVSVNLMGDLKEIKNPITLIYGSEDTATPPQLVEEVFSEIKSQSKLFVIQGGGHDIANTHTKELISLIKGVKK